MNATVAIVVKDDLRGLSALLRSLRRSFSASDDHFPILIFDNASNEAFRWGLENLLEDYKDLSVSVHRRVVNSMSEARQQALMTATTEWVCFLDSDCRVLPGWMAQARAHLLTMHPRGEIWGWSGPSLFRGWHPLRRVMRIFSRFFPAHKKSTEPRRVSHIPTSHVFYRRETVLSIGGFLPGTHRAGEDMALSLKIRAKGGQLALLPAPRIFHAQVNTPRAFLRRLFTYGEVHGTLCWRHPKHILSPQFLPLYLAALSIALLIVYPKIFVGFAVITLATLALILGRSWHRLGLILAAVVAYALGTAKGLAFRSVHEY